MNAISILTYHSIDVSGSVVSCAPQDFSDQMTYLSDEGFRGVSLREAVAHRQRHGSWPTKSVALTFDDGFANFYEHALPVLVQHNFAATVFVISGHMNGLNNWDEPPAELGTQKMLSWQQAAEVAASGVEIGSHTRTHPNLRRCSASEAEHEMTASRDEIENNLGLQVQSFAYPYGEIDQISRELAARSFRASCTTELRRANGDALNLLPRLDMHYLRSRRTFARLLDGQLDHYLTFRRWGRLARRIVVADPGAQRSRVWPK